jgi:hypothetical protein
MRGGLLARLPPHRVPRAEDALGAPGDQHDLGTVTGSQTGGGGADAGGDTGDHEYPALNVHTNDRPSFVAIRHPGVVVYRPRGVLREALSATRHPRATARGRARSG